MIEYAKPINELKFADSVYFEDFQSERFSYDIWAGRAFRFSERNSFALALRLDHDNYWERPQVAIDSNELYHDSNFLLGSISYNKIKFLKSKNIIAFNITEDIPVGFVFSYLYGRDWSEFGVRSYQGVKASYASYFKYGYVFLNYEQGAFTRNSTTINKVNQINVRHFTPIFHVGKAQARIYTRLYYFTGDNLSIPQAHSRQTHND